MAKLDPIVKLEQIIKEMQDPKNYYSQPQRSSQVTCVVPAKQTEWISRLYMIKEELTATT